MTIPPVRRRSAATLALGSAALVLAAIFLALGTWQLERRAWKLDLIARVEARVHASPVSLPDASEWPLVDAAGAEYRAVMATGRFLPGPATLVQAVTERGPGFWALAALRTEAGATVLVNRGFVPPEAARLGVAPPDGMVTVTGLLRLTEPGGGFLRRNDPAASRWFSRDVAAIAAARDLGPTAPFFIDADASANRDGAPVGGLTAVTFRNAHLVYALTWFGLAVLSVGAWIAILRETRKGEHRKDMAHGEPRRI